MTKVAIIKERAGDTFVSMYLPVLLWIDEDVTVCFQLVESNSKEKLQQCIGYWNDLADFEVIPVIDSQTRRNKFLQPH